MTAVIVRCAVCGLPAAVTDYTCRCGGGLVFEYPLAGLDGWRPSGTGMARYLPLLPVPGLPASMGEGGTPLVESRAIGPALGIRLYFKLESLNPTGSYKDRIASIGAALAAAHGRPALVATSSGNAGAAIAAYATRAGLRAVLVVPEEVPPPKLAQIRAYGGVAIAVRRVLSGPDAVAAMFEAVRRTAEDRGWLLMITAHRYAPAAMEGVKTIALEIIETLGDAPDRAYLPVGGGGLLAATWRGFEQARALRWTERTPRMIAVQPRGCAPVVQAAMGQTPSAGTVSTRVSGLQVAHPPDADLVLAALRDSEGAALAESDDAILEAQRRLAQEEAIFSEPAGATALAGLLADASAGRLPRGTVAVCVVTGSGFKDPAGLAQLPASSVLDLDDLDRLPDVAAQLVGAKG